MAHPHFSFDPLLTPDAVELGGDTVFLLSKLHQSVFRWSVSQQMRSLPSDLRRRG